MTQVATVDLFCGAGGLTYGLERAGIPVVAGVDVDPACQYPYETNTEATFVEADVGNFTGEDLRALYPDDCDVEILVGCAPCRPFSHMSNGHTDADAEEWDLLDEFRRLVEAVGPDVLVMENVSQLAAYEVYERFKAALDTSRACNGGYAVSDGTIACVDYGVPQTRRRLLLLASQFAELELVPPSHEFSDQVTVRRTLAPLDLPAIDAGERADTDPLHVAAELRGKNPERIRQSKPGGSWRDWDPKLRARCHERASGNSYVSTYGRMEWDEPAPTITTQFYNYGSGRFGHPAWDEDPEESVDRALSLREGALLQTYPPEYEFAPDVAATSKAEIGRLVGNAVPVRVAAAIGGSIRRHLKQHGVAPDTWTELHSSARVPPCSGTNDRYLEVAMFLAARYDGLDSDTPPEHV